MFKVIRDSNIISIQDIDRDSYKYIGVEFKVGRRGFVDKIKMETSMYSIVRKSCMIG